MQGRNPARFNGGYGVPRGFKGEKSKSPPNPLGLAERVPRPADGGRSKREVEGVLRRWKAFVPIVFMPNILLFSDARQAYEAQEAYEAYEAQEPIFLKEDRLFLSGNFIKQRFSEISSILQFQNTLIR